MTYNVSWWYPKLTTLNATTAPKDGGSIRGAQPKPDAPGREERMMAIIYYPNPYMAIYQKYAPRHSSAS